MKKTIAWLVLAGWIVLIVGVMTLIFIENPFHVLAIVLTIIFALAMIGLAWALGELDLL